MAIRAADHPAATPRYDREVFEFSGPVPQIDPHPGYVKQLTGDGSGLPLPINGTAIFAITMRPAQAHNAQGQATASTRISGQLRNVQQIKSAVTSRRSCPMASACATHRSSGSSR